MDIMIKGISPEIKGEKISRLSIQYTTTSVQGDSKIENNGVITIENPKLKEDLAVSISECRELVLNALGTGSMEIKSELQTRIEENKGNGYVRIECVFDIQNIVMNGRNPDDEIIETLTRCIRNEVINDLKNQSLRRRYDIAPRFIGGYPTYL